MLQKQESLSSLSLQCHNLIDVDLSDCESLTNAICEVFSDGGGCPMLRSLILDNCEVCHAIFMPFCAVTNVLFKCMGNGIIQRCSTLLSFFCSSCILFVPLFLYFQDISDNLFCYTQFLMAFFSFYRV